MTPRAWKAISIVVRWHGPFYPGGPLRALILRNLALSKRMLTLAAQTVTMLSDRIEEYVSNDVKTRLAHALAALDGNPDEPLAITHQELAALIGTTQTQVTKALAELRRAGLVATSRHRRGIAVLDAEALASFGAPGSQQNEGRARRASDRGRAGVNGPRVCHLT